MVAMQMQRIKELEPIQKKQQIKKEMRVKTFGQNIWATSITNCLKNTVTVKTLAAI